MKKIVIQLFILFFGFLLLDFLFGNFFFKSRLQDNVYEKNNNFIYNFKKNLEIKNYYYGNKKYDLCTNNLGAIDDCDNKNINSKKIDYTFIGDSFVEGLGIEFKSTFFGLLKNKYSSKNFLNLGVSGYSPSIIYKKLKYFYESGYEFSEIFIFLDPSDIFDEIYRYKTENDDRISINLTNDEVNKLLEGKKKLINNIYNNFPGSFYLISLIIKLLPKFSFIENYYLDLMINHPFGKWSYGQSNLYSKNNLNKSLEKNSYYVNKIIELVNKNETKVTFVLYPWPGHIYEENTNNKYNKHWTNFFKNKNIKLVNLNTQFFKFLNNKNSKDVIFKYYIHGDVHFNQEGHKLIFDNIDNIISKE